LRFRFRFRFRIRIRIRIHLRLRFRGGGGALLLAHRVADLGRWWLRHRRHAGVLRVRLDRERPRRQPDQGADCPHRRAR
jgi:hypothetical protein